MVFGVVTPLRLNSAPARLSMEMVRSEPPELVIKRLLDVFNPVDTVPKLMEVGLTAICDCGLTTVADRFTTAGEVPWSA